MGKIKSVIWKFFKKTEKKNFFVCMFCNKRYKRNATRMRLHLGNCDECPFHLKGNSRTEKENLLSTIEQQNELDLVSNSKSNNLILANLTDILSNNEKVMLDQKLAKAIYTSGCPFSVVDNKQWQDLFHYLRPSYNLPSMEQVSNELLNQEYELVRSHIISKIKSAELVAIQCDSWTNIQNVVVINFIVTIPEPILYKSLYTNFENLAGEYIADEILKGITEIGSHKIFAIISDNTNAVEKAKKLVMDKYNHIFSYSCASNVLKLLIEDIMEIDSLLHIECLCRNIVKEITSSHHTLVVFNKIQKKKYDILKILTLPNKTRWESVFQCIESLIATKEALQILVTGKEKEKVQLSKSIEDHIKDDTFWIKLQKVENILKPIVNWIKILETNSGTISKVYLAQQEIRSALTEHLTSVLRNSDELTKIIEIFEKREIMSANPLHLAAYLLDPNFHGKALSSEEYYEAIDFIDKLISNNPKFLEFKGITSQELIHYLAKSSLWKRDFLWNSAAISQAIAWWKGLCCKTRLKDVAVAILGLPVKPVTTKHIFTQYLSLNLEKQNYLASERAAGLVYIAYNSKFLNKIEACFTNSMDLDNKY